MYKKEMIAMLLAGGAGSRLGILTVKKAKPAVSFGGKYRIIDFPMSNCINSGVDTVGVLTQYQPLLLNQHIGIGIPWDLDKQNGGVTILAPHVKGDAGEWFTGTANSIYQNINYIDEFNPEYVLVLGGDHIYKMDYSKMLDFHKQNQCDATIAVQEVSMDEATRLGIMNVNQDDSIYEFEEKPKHPKSNLASMGIYIFTWDKLKDCLICDSKLHPDSDFGKHIIPLMMERKMTMFAYRFNDFWKDVGTIESYWEANMELIKTLPEFNLYEDFWKIYTDAKHQPPQYTGKEADVRTSLISEGCQIYGTVHNSVLGHDVVVREGAVVRDSIIMSNSCIGSNTLIDRCIIDENSTVGANSIIGAGENVPNTQKPKVYYCGITIIGEKTTVPDNVIVGKNCVIFGETKLEHYTDSESDLIQSGTLILDIEDEDEIDSDLEERDTETVKTQIETAELNPDEKADSQAIDIKTEPYKHILRSGGTIIIDNEVMS